MKRILVLPDDWEIWLSLEGDGPKPEVWWLTDEAYKRLEDGVDPNDLLDDGKVRRRETITWPSEELDA